MVVGGECPPYQMCTKNTGWGDLLAMVSYPGTCGLIKQEGLGKQRFETSTF